MLRHNNMRIHRFIMLLLAMGCVLPLMIAADSPESIVRELYQPKVARKPLGIPKKADKVAILPFLSKGLIRRLDAAQARETDYLQKHAGGDEEPASAWLETRLFSDASEKSFPAEARVGHSQKQTDGSILVYLRLAYK